MLGETPPPPPLGETPPPPPSAPRSFGVSSFDFSFFDFSNVGSPKDETPKEKKGRERSERKAKLEQEEKDKEAKKKAKEEAKKNKPAVDALHARADELVRVPLQELPADTRVEVGSLGRGNYVRPERRFMRADRHWVRFDSLGGAQLALTAAKLSCPPWNVIKGGKAMVSAVGTGFSFEVELPPGLTMLELYEESGRKAGGVPAQCVRLAIVDGTPGGGQLLASLVSVAVAEELVSAAGVREGVEMVLSVADRAVEGTADWALGLPAEVHAGVRAVADLRRRRAGLRPNAPEEVVALVLAARAAARSDEAIDVQTLMAMDGESRVVLVAALPHDVKEIVQTAVARQHDDRMLQLGAEEREAAIGALPVAEQALPRRLAAERLLCRLETAQERAAMLVELPCVDVGAGCDAAGCDACLMMRQTAILALPAAEQAATRAALQVAVAERQAKAMMALPTAHERAAMLLKLPAEEREAAIGALPAAEHVVAEQLQVVAQQAAEQAARAAAARAAQDRENRDREQRARTEAESMAASAAGPIGHFVDAKPDANSADLALLRLDPADKTAPAAAQTLIDALDGDREVGTQQNPTQPAVAVCLLTIHSY